MMDTCQRAYYALRRLDEAGYLSEAVGKYSGLTPESGAGYFLAIQ